MKDAIVLTDWMTTPKIKLNTKITADSDNGYHKHDFYEIFYIIEGTVTHKINGKTEILVPGDIVFLRLNDMHSFEREPNSKCKHRDIVIAPEQYERTCNYINENLLQSIKSSATPSKTRLPLAHLNYLEQKFNDYVNIPLEDTVKKTSAANILLAELLYFLVFPRRLTEKQKYPAWFEQLLARFNMNFYIKSGLNVLLDDFNYDRSYMCRTFKKHMGVSMSQYLCRIRLQYASLLLTSTNKTVTEIANDVGFSSTSCFNTKFKKEYKITPKEYRKSTKDNYKNPMI